MLIFAKKNVKTLENIKNFLEDTIESEGTEKLQYPVMLIDDEADNASIQSLSTKHFNEWEVGLELQNKDKEELTDLMEKYPD